MNMMTNNETATATTGNQSKYAIYEVAANEMRTKVKKGEQFAPTLKKMNKMIFLKMFIFLSIFKDLV